MNFFKAFCSRCSDQRFGKTVACEQYSSHRKTSKFLGNSHFNNLTQDYVLEE